MLPLSLLVDCFFKDYFNLILIRYALLNMLENDKKNVSETGDGITF